MESIKFVYFDLGGVALNYQVAIQALSKYIDRPYKDVFEVFAKYNDDVCRGNITVAELWEIYQKDLKIVSNIEDFLEWWTDNMQPYLETHNLMKQVSQKYKIGLITNLYAEVLPRLIEKGHVPNLDYSALVESHEWGLMKPEKEFFLHAQKLAKVDPEEILFIDDSQVNIEAAKKLNWNTVWFDEKNPEKSILEVKRLLNLN